jgi:hypothetical protein
MAEKLGLKNTGFVGEFRAAKKDRICGRNTRNIFQKTQNMWPKHADLRNMCPKSTEYVAETRKICVRKAQNMWPKDLWLNFALPVHEYVNM